MINTIFCSDNNTTPKKQSEDLLSEYYDSTNKNNSSINEIEISMNNASTYKKNYKNAEKIKLKTQKMNETFKSDNTEVKTLLLQITSLTDGMYKNMSVFSVEHKIEINNIFKEISETISILSKEYDEFEIIDSLSVNSKKNLNNFNRLNILFNRLKNIEIQYSEKIQNEINKYSNQQQNLNLSIISNLLSIVKHQNDLTYKYQKMKQENENLKEDNQSLSEENISLLNENFRLKSDLEAYQKSQNDKSEQIQKQDDESIEELTNLINMFGEYSELETKIKISQKHQNQENMDKLKMSLSGLKDKINEISHNKF